MLSVCVFCGSSVGNHPGYAHAAREAARLLVRKGCRIIFGGGHVGLMGVTADAALAAGGYVIGISPRILQEKEVVHRGLSELHVVDSVHERKVMMAGLADAFLVLPGGFGTLDELFEVLTLQQLTVHDKPVGVFNVNGFFDPLMAYLDHAVASGFLRRDCREMLMVDTDAARLLARVGVV
ncbi:MAG: TIGR00730 family Rossman fold protein [Betaproteobacteria bacterium]|nr:TIGR00730 family Rossman fold protein [Betaproteobacteria bacterium]